MEDKSFKIVKRWILMTIGYILLIMIEITACFAYKMSTGDPLYTAKMFNIFFLLNTLYWFIWMLVTPKHSKIEKTTSWAGIVISIYSWIITL